MKSEGLFLTLTILLTVFLIGCKKDCLKNDNCDLVPISGNCDGSFTKYYFDKEEGKCKKFTWGGCGGVVPFDTLEECEEADCN